MAIGMYFVENRDYSLKEVLNVINNFNVYEEAIIRPLTVCFAASTALTFIFAHFNFSFPDLMTIGASSLGAAMSFITLGSCVASPLLNYGLFSNDFLGIGKYALINTPIENYNIYEGMAVSIPQAMGLFCGCVRYLVTEFPLYYRSDGNDFLRIQDGNMGGLDVHIKVQDAKYSGIELVNFLNDFDELSVWAWEYRPDKHELVSKFLLHEYDKTECAMLPDNFSIRNGSSNYAAVLGVHESEFRQGKGQEENSDIDGLVLVQEASFDVEVTSLHA